MLKRSLSIPGLVRGGVLMGVVGLAAAIAQGEPAAAPVAPEKVLQWQNGQRFSAFKLPAEALETRLSQLKSRDGARNAVMTFSGPLSERERKELAASGVRVNGYLTADSYYVSLDRETLDPAALARDARVLSVSAIRPSWKMHRDILDGKVYDWQVVGLRGPAPDGEGEDRSRWGENEHKMVALYVLLHEGEALETEGAKLIKSLGGEVRSYIRGLNGMVVHLPVKRIDELASKDAVLFIEPPLPKFSEMNAENRVITGSDIAQAAPYGLDGTGVDVMVYDGGTVRDSHAAFGGRATLGDTDGTSDHATHVAGTVAAGFTGSGVDPTERGMAPNANIVSYGFEQPGGLQEGFLYTDPGDMEADYTEAVTVFGADITNNSIGTNTAPNGFPCDWTGNYNVTSALIDGLVRGDVIGQNVRVVWANGNERQTSRCGDLYQTTAPPACAKNHITVGALNANNDSVTSFTSWGPADDGRLKPDVSGPGCESGGDGGVRSLGSFSDTDYGVKCGTSMSSPTVCGIGALLIQDWRNFYGSTDMLPSTLKAFLAHTAADIENPGPDFKTGYGSVRAPAAIDQLRSGNFVEESVDQGGSYAVVVIVNPGDTEMKVTLAWDDVPAAVSVDETLPRLVNDLDLVVTSPSGVRAYPWTLDILNPSADAVRTQENRVDNLEQVFVENPEAGAWFVEVSGFNVPQGPQPFSLVASPFLVNCADAGTASLDSTQYPCSSSAELQVIDCGLNTSDAVVDTVDVLVFSSSDSVGEMVTLTETAPESAAFLGSVTLGASAGAGVVAVANGDTLTLRYNDADDGTGSPAVVEDTAAIDCVAPIVTNASVIDVQPRDATVNVTTDEDARITIRWGTACGSFTDSVQSPQFGTSVDLNLVGLSDETTYFFEVEAEDRAGNIRVDDNGGGCYQFTTPEIPDFFTELFDADDNDLANTAVLFAPAANIDQYAACNAPIFTLPTDPAGGNVLSLSDSDDVEVFVGGGQSVVFYGQSYTSFWVGSNGYITFGSGDSDSTESIDDHFSQPRIAALFDDLDVTEGGTISWKQETDRMVVTWENVPEDATSGANLNTFQIEMYFDGRIQIAWLDISVADGLAGLSEGNGTNADFFESDLTSYGACPPRPPSAASQNLSVPQGLPTTIDLVAGDEGLPDPPGALTYTVTSLPMEPLRDAGDNALITSVPYTLLGSSVVYEPASSFAGNDGFTWVANDGGTPPDGGDSNTASVSIFVEPVLDLPFFDDFESGSFDPFKWASATAEIDNLGIDEPSPTLSARFNGSPDGSDEITSLFIDMSPYAAAEVSYWYQQTGGGESPDSGDDLFLEFLDDQGNWQILDQQLGSGPDETVYTRVEVNLPPSAFHSGFRLRVRNIGTASSTSVFDDWFVDDVRISIADAPEAMNVAVSTPVFTPVDVTLDAVDPTMDPLDYVITSLPADGTLTDPNAGAVNAVPYTIAAGGDTVTYSPNGGYQGTDSFDWFATDGTFDSNAAVADITVGGPQVQYEFLVDDSNPGWTTEGGWAFGPVTGGGTSGRTDPNGGFTGANVYGYVLDGSYPNNLGEEFLTSTAIDCSDLTGVTVEFRRWLGVESSSFDNARFQVSNDGTNWVDVWIHSGGTLNEQAWSLQSYDISAVADNQSAVYLRWQMGTTDSSVQYQGWNIDDVRIIALAPVACPGDADGNGVVDVNDITEVVNFLGDTGAPGIPGDVDGNGVVDVNDITEVVNFLGVACSN